MPKRSKYAYNIKHTSTGTINIGNMNPPKTSNIKKEHQNSWFPEDVATDSLFRFFLSLFLRRCEVSALELYKRTGIFVDRGYGDSEEEKEI